MLIMSSFLLYNIKIKIKKADLQAEIIRKSVRCN